MGIAAKSEKGAQRAILDYLALIGAFAIRINSGGVVSEYKGRRRFVRFNNQPGCTDIVCCVAGSFVGIEVKGPDGRLTPKQAACIDAIRVAGGLAIVATSVADVERALREENLLP